LTWINRRRAIAVMEVRKQSVLFIAIFNGISIHLADAPLRHERS
jgi:hypothetical protein